MHFIETHLAGRKANRRIGQIVRTTGVRPRATTQYGVTVIRWTAVRS